MTAGQPDLSRPAIGGKAQVGAAASYGPPPLPDMTDKGYWNARREPDWVRHAALGLAVDHHRRRVGDVAAVADVIDAAKTFEAYLAGEEVTLG